MFKAIKQWFQARQARKDEIEYLKGYSWAKHEIEFHKQHPEFVYRFIESEVFFQGRLSAFNNGAQACADDYLIAALELKQYPDIEVEPKMPEEKVKLDVKFLPARLDFGPHVFLTPLAEE